MAESVPGRAQFLVMRKRLPRRWAGRITTAPCPGLPALARSHLFPTIGVRPFGSAPVMCTALEAA